MKKIYNYLLMLITLGCFGTHTLSAQINLATSATASAYTPDPNGLWNWSQINDNSFNTCNNQEAFIWTSSTGITGTEYMQWTWSSAKSINKIRFHNANSTSRNLTGGDVFYYNGSTYVFWKTITIAQACLDSVSFPTVTTTSLRITNFKMTGAGQQSNPNWREIEVISGPSVDEDAGVSGLSNLSMCSYSQTIKTNLFNFGKKTLDSFFVHWSVNGVNQSSFHIKGKLGTAKDTTITLDPSFTFTANTNYNFKIWTSQPNGQFDSVAANDTFRSKLGFLGNPTPPTTADFKQCGNGKPTLTATPNLNSDSVLWYDKSTGGNLLGIGKSITGPYITASKTFYAQAMKFGGSSIIGFGYTGTGYLSGDLSSYNGNMFKVDVTNSIVLDSITFELWQNTPNSGYSLYYKVGNYVGFETNSGAWTKISSGQVRYMNIGGDFLGRIPANSLLLQGGTTYSFYYTTDPGPGSGNDIYATYGALTKSNGDIAISGGSFIYGLFATNGIYNVYTGNFEMMYSKQCSNPSRTPINITVKPRPTGADYGKSTTFDGQFNIGDYTKPDVAEVDKKIIYKIIPPTGFNNTNHGTAWKVSSYSAYTRYGVLVPPTEYITNDPTGSSDGTIELTPKSFYLDSFITFNINYADLGPNFCDSTIKRTLVVAPTPKPNFKLPSAICVGEAIPFENLSQIHSGNMTFMWYFGDGDSSDLNSPVHEYKTAGPKTIRLKVTSFPWGTINDTSMTIQVGELPDVKFRVNNKCEGIAVTFQNQTTVGTGTLNYTWNFGDNSPTSAVVNPTHLYAAPNGYKVTLTASANGCIAKLSKNAYMFARPDANFATPLAPVCAKSEVQLPNTSTIASGNQGAFWTFGDGGSSTQFQGLYNYAAPGTYNIKLLAVSEFDCKDSITKPITIKATPSPDFSGDLFCGNKSTKFTNTTNEVIPNPVYAWKFSDGYTSPFKNVTRTWPYEGPFTGKLTATYSNGCTDFIEKNFTVLIQPKASFEVNDICAGEVAKLVNTTKGDQSNIISFWEFGDGVTSSTWSPEKLYNPSATTTYTVSLVSSYNGGCKDTMRKSLTVSEAPICNFTFESLGFRNTKFTPSNTTYSKYTWLFGEGGGSEMASPTYKYSYSGNFTVTMRAMNSAGCECEVTKKVLSNTDIQDVSDNGNIQIYPNPNNGQFTVSNTENAQMKIEIFNVLGVKITSVDSVEGSLNLDLNDQANGIYIVKITINGLTVTKKITKN